MKRVTKTIVAIAAVMLMVAPAARANLLTNGDFEAGTNPTNFTPLNPGSLNITGWTITRGQIDYIGTEWPAASG